MVFFRNNKEVVFKKRVFKQDFNNEDIDICVNIEVENFLGFDLLEKINR